MNWLEAIVLGAVQGLTEFLPVSSSGHLVVTEEALGLHMPGITLEVLLHIATLLAVAIVYWRRILGLLRGVAMGERDAIRFAGLVIVASVPAGVIGFTLKDFFERAFDSIAVVGVDFIITGFILWSTRSLQRAEGAAVPAPRGAFLIGLAQACAIMPGISRAGSTIAAGLWLGLRPAAAAEFSFLMSIPAVAGAGLLQARDADLAQLSAYAGPATAAFLAALVAGVLAIRLLVRLLRHGEFHRFAPYCWLLGATVLLTRLV